MKYVSGLVIGLLVLLTSLPVESDTSTVPYYMYNAASEFELDIALLYAICRVESNCKPKAINHDDGTQSQKDAGIVDKSYGMFQIKVSTAKSLGFVDAETVVVDRIRKGKVVKVKKTVRHTQDLLRPEINSWYAAKLLRHLYDRYGDTVKVISAYNAGHYIKSNKDYVNKVLRQYARYKIDKRY